MKKKLAKGPIIYIDEAGRGPLAGPVWVGGILVLKKFSTDGFGDSKKLSHLQRELCYDKIHQVGLSDSFLFSSSYSRASTIDRIGIIAAQRLAMKKMIRSLHAQYEEYRGSKLIDLRNIHVVMDGNHCFGLERFCQIEAIIKADEKIPYVGMASIIAKVERDRFMRSQAKKFPDYGFERHKGYGTQLHRDMIREHGLCAIHRKGFCQNFVHYQ